MMISTIIFKNSCALLSLAMAISASPLLRASESCDAKDLLVISFTTDRFPSETSWKLKSLQDGVDTLLSKGVGEYSKWDNLYSDTLCLTELQDQCFSFEVYDTYGDGISYCYSYSSDTCGSYSITLNDDILVDGGHKPGYWPTENYWKEKTNQFCVGSAELPSSAPTSSRRPSISPTMSPSSGPTNSLDPSASPSMSPSSGPTNSLDPSASPSMSPSFDCEADQTLSILVKTDSYPWETSWKLKSQDGSTILSKSDYQTRHYLYGDLLCLSDMPPQCYVFEIFDSYGDGLSGFYCQLSMMNDFRCGSYKLILNEEVVVKSGTKSNWRKQTYQFCTGGVEPPPSAAPTLKPIREPKEDYDYYGNSFNPIGDDMLDDFVDDDMFNFVGDDQYSQGDYDYLDDLLISNPIIEDEYVDDDYDFGGIVEDLLQNLEELLDEQPLPSQYPTHDPTFQPTNTPTTPVPSSSPTFSCIDDTDLKYQDKASKDCDWVGSEKTKKRCKKDWEGMKLFDFCPLTCSEVGLGGCV